MVQVTAESTDAPALPGLELPATPGGSALVEAVKLTLLQLQDDGHLDGKRDAARVQLALSLAATIDHKRTSGRASTVGQDAKVLLDLLDGLVPAEAATGMDLQLQAAMATWSAEVEAQAKLMAARTVAE